MRSGSWLLTLALGLAGSAALAQEAPDDGSGRIHITPSSGLARLRASDGARYNVPNAPSATPRPTDLKYDGRYRYITYSTTETLPSGVSVGYFSLWDEGTGTKVK